jgi:phosphatidylethanolamine-binding protein (PEBP) family uncharacterized protein
MQEESKEEERSSSSTSCDFSKWRVNPDVIQSNPQTLASVKYHHKEMTLGQTLLVKDTQTRPEIQLAKDAPTAPFYTLIMCDPDAPSNSNPKFRNWCHWIVVNIPTSFQLNEGHTVCPYMGPAPPPDTGLHRYVFMVYPQQSAMSGSGLKEMHDADRKSWHVDTFLKSHTSNIASQVPIAGQMFRCQNEHQTSQKEESPWTGTGTPDTKREETRHAEKKEHGKK